MERVGFLSALLAKGAASVMKRFLQSHAWHHWLSTLVLGSSPILVAPTSWMISPPREMAPTEVTLPPAARMISWNVSCMCLACRISSWLHSVSYTHLRAHETVLDLVCRLLLEKK